jgi:hypothetical protein
MGGCVMYIRYHMWYHDAGGCFVALSRAPPGGVSLKHPAGWCGAGWCAAMQLCALLASVQAAALYCSRLPKYLRCAPQHRAACFVGCGGSKWCCTCAQRRCVGSCSCSCSLAFGNCLSPIRASYLAMQYIQGDDATSC